MIKKIFLLLGVFSLMACSVNQAKSDSEAVLFNPIITADALEVSVMSNGCTTAEDFYLKVSEDVIELRRLKYDNCRATPRWIRLSFEYPFGDRAYRIKNKVRLTNRVR
jgi:hypothetical protein